MSVQVQFRRGTTAESDLFTGALGEVTVDTTLKTVRVHDGFTPGGSPLISSVFTNNTQAFSTSTGSMQLKGGMSINTGNLYIGGSGGTAIVATGNILPSANLLATNNLGSDTAWWNNFYGVSTQARYADLAENYQADLDYAPGTVLSFGGASEVTVSSVSHDAAVAGVVSTNPAHLMNSALNGNNVVAMALQGRVPCQVKGPITKGTLLVTSDIPGTAQALDNSRYQPGCIIGKSLGTIIDDSIQLIEIVVGRV